MSDITKCPGDNCPLKETCYRFTAIANTFRQFYFIKSPIKENKTCDDYWEDNYEYKIKLKDE